jgi:hypothetical protein
VGSNRRRRRARKAAEQQERERALAAAAVARGRESRVEARQQIARWNAAGLDREPKSERKPKSVWVSVLPGGSPGSGR